MVVAMNVLNNKLNKMEEGTGGISYAMYFVAIIMTIVLFVFFKFNCDLYVIEETMETGLHVAENRVLTANQDEVDASGRSDIYERETNRLNIVTNYTKSSSSMSTVESDQIRLLANAFSEALQEQMNLNGSEPQGSILKQMCGEGAKIYISEMRIIEPVYSRTVTKTEIGQVSNSTLKDYSFDVVYNIDQWIIYTLSFNDNNEYLGVTKSFSSNAPVLSRKDHPEAEGATIDATLTTSFAGVRNIFAAAPSSSPVITKNAIHFGEQYNNVTADAVDWSGMDTPIFAANPTRNIYTVDVSQSVDIVVAHQDKRKK